MNDKPKQCWFCEHGEITHLNCKKDGKLHKTTDVCSEYKEG